MGRKWTLGVVAAVVAGGVLATVGLMVSASDRLPMAPGDVPPLPILGGVLLMVAAAVWGQRSSRRGSGRAWIGRAIGACLVAGLVLLAIVAVVADQAGERETDPRLQADRPKGQPKQPIADNAVGSAPATTPPDPLATASVVLAVLILVGLVVVAAAVITVAVTRRRAERRPSDLSPADIQRAVAAGRDAIGSPGPATAGARTAVIAAYAAMERAFTAAGVERRRTDTPADLLSRAAERGLLSSSAIAAADELATLFRRARFSTDELPADAVDSARRAFDRIESGLLAGDRVDASR